MPLIPDNFLIRENNKVYFLDTNVILSNTELLDQLEKFIISSITLEELENIKISSKKDESVKYQARKSVRYLKANQDKFDVIPLTEKHYNILVNKKLKETNDNLIIATVYSESMYRDIVFVTEDLLCEIFARDIFGLEVESNLFRSLEDEDYKGFKEILLDTNDEKDNKILAKLYEEPYNNTFKLLTNEYLIIKDKQIPIHDENFEFIEGYKPICILKWDGNSFVRINDNPFNSMLFGRTKPLDVYQSIAFDNFKNNQMIMIKGRSGSGKSLLSLSYIFNMIESGKYSKLIVATNSTNAKNSEKHGYLPGSILDKLLDSQIGNMLSYKLGGRSEVLNLVDKNKLSLIPFSSLRGVDFTGSNAIIYITECQNLDIELLKLGIQRVGEDCKLILDGDYNAQVDMNAYEGLNNGMRRASEVFRGEDFYGEVELQTVFRSKLAKIADKM